MWLDSVKCGTINTGFSALGDAARATGPANTSARYITMYRAGLSSPDFLSLAVPVPLAAAMAACRHAASVAICTRHMVYSKHDTILWTPQECVLVWALLALA